MADFGDILSDEPKESFFLPPGVIMPYGGTSTVSPDGWLFCNGQSYGTAAYPELFPQWEPRMEALEQHLTFQT